MSRAFVREQDVDYLEDLPERPVSAHPNDVTEAGLAQPTKTEISDTGILKMPDAASGIPFDPIKENKPIFDGWPKPKLALVITGMEEGYLEPCGCAGLDRIPFLK